jgi:hypothetical protein
MDKITMSSKAQSIDRQFSPEPIFVVVLTIYTSSLYWLLVKTLKNYLIARLVNFFISF